ncbi:MAG: radical SAM protein [Candidatus Moranbacteria bacterium]|nr:radical SAM protein [Candidatus Moranbacteria bacterium]
MKLKSSPFLHIIYVGDGYVALYNSLSLNVVFVEENFVSKNKNDSIWSTEDNESCKLFEQLKTLGFLIEEDYDGYDDYHKYQEILNKPSINILYLLLTDSCNLRCKYCYFLAPMPKEHHFSFMKKETALMSIDLFSRCVKKSREEGHEEQHIVLYGGEPTLNKDVLISSLKYIDDLKSKLLLPKTTNITLNTNGILLDEDILDQCKESGVIVAVSIDGPKIIHDEMRVYPLDKGTYDDVLKSYKRAQEKGVKTGVCVTIDEHNLDKLPELVPWISKDLNASGFGFNILIENLKNQSKEDAEIYSELVADKLIEGFKVARRLGVYEDRIMRRVKPFLDKETVLSDCGGCGLQIVVSPEGKIGVCQAFCGEGKYFVEEDLRSFVPEEHPFWKEWRKRSPLTNKDCIDCIALGNCGGGCPYNAYRTKGGIEEIDERFCFHAKRTTLFLIKDLWKKQKH